VSELHNADTVLLLQIFNSLSLSSLLRVNILSHRNCTRFSSVETSTIDWKFNLMCRMVSIRIPSILLIRQKFEPFETSALYTESVRHLADSQQLL